MKDTAGKIALGIIGVATATVGIFLAMLPRVIVKIAVDYSDNLIWPVCVVYNKTIRPLYLKEFQITLDKVSWDWEVFSWAIPPKTEEYKSPGWINPLDYGIDYGLHTAYLKWKDIEGRIYKSNAISFIVKSP